MRNVQKISAVVLGMLAGFAINKYATVQNFAKLKGKIKETYDDLSKKLEEATEPKVEYVPEDEVSVDDDLLESCSMMTIKCKDSDFARFLRKHIQIIIDTKGYITINDIIDLDWLSDDTIHDIAGKYTFNECATMGWSNRYEHRYEALSSVSDQDYMLISYPDDLTDLIHDVEYGDVAVDESLLTQAMDILGDRSEDEDILFIGTIGFDKLSDAYYAMSCILEKLVDKKSYFTVYELVYTLFEDEPLMFDHIRKNIDSSILMEYGWVDPSAFEIHYNLETGKYIITDVAPVRLYTNEEKANEDKNTEPDTGSAEDTNVM